MENQSKSNIEAALKWGLILGMANIVLYLLLYMIDKSLLANWWLGLIIIAIDIVMMVMPIRARRAEMGGFISFKDAFIIGFITFAGAMLLSTIFTYVLYNLIDPGLSEYMKEKVLEKTVAFMEKLGTPQEEIDKAVERIQNDSGNQGAPATLGKQYIFGLIFGAVLAAIVGAIMKKAPKYSDIE